MKTVAIHVQYHLPISAIETIEENAWDFDCLCVSHEPPHQDAWPAELSGLPEEGDAIARITFTDHKNANMFNEFISNLLGLEGEIIEEEVSDWEDYHYPYSQPILLERLIINPIEAPPVDQQVPLTIYLAPGLGFGTGRHETTRTCLRLLESLDITDKTVIDFGCGSGILAIAALKLDAKHAQYHDHDPQALRSTQDNLKYHDYDTSHFQGQVKGSSLVPADIVMANILWEPLNILCEQLVALIQPGGMGIFSGLLKEQEELFIKRYSPFLSLEKVLEENGWIGILMSKPKL